MDKFLGNLSSTLSMWFHIVVAALTSWWGVRIEAVLGASLVVGISLLIAYRQRMAVQERYLELKPFRGPKPKHKHTILKQLAEIEKIRSVIIQNLSLRAFLVFVFGFVVPSAVFVLAINYYQWFIPGGYALARSGCGGATPINIDLGATAAFVVSQFVMGSSNLVGEMASHQSFLSASTDLSPSNAAVNLALIGYRYFIAIFVGAFAQLTYSAIQAVRWVTPKEKELNEALKNAE